MYSSNPRMECLTPQFDGEKVRIRYQFHSEGLIEGDIQRGCFTIVCSQKEYSLPFCVTIGKEYPEADFGQQPAGEGPLCRKEPVRIIEHNPPADNCLQGDYV